MSCARLVLLQSFNVDQDAYVHSFNSKYYINPVNPDKAPALINNPCLFSGGGGGGGGGGRGGEECYINLHEFLLASVDDVALWHGVYV